MKIKNKPSYAILPVVCVMSGLLGASLSYTYIKLREKHLNNIKTNALNDALEKFFKDIKYSRQTIKKSEEKTDEDICA